MELTKYKISSYRERQVKKVKRTAVLLTLFLTFIFITTSLASAETTLSSKVLKKVQEVDMTGNSTSVAFGYLLIQLVDSTKADWASYTWDQFMDDVDSNNYDTIYSYMQKFQSDYSNVMTLYASNSDQYEGMKSAYEYYMKTACKEIYNIIEAGDEITGFNFNMSTKDAVEENRVFVAGELTDSVFDSLDDILNDKFDTLIMENFNTLYAGGWQHGETQRTINVFIMSIYNAIKIFGIALIGFYVVLAFLKELQRGDITPESMLRVVAYALIAVCFLVFLNDILNMFDLLGNGIKDAVASVVSSKSVAGENIEAEIESALTVAFPSYSAGFTNLYGYVANFCSNLIMLAMWGGTKISIIICSIHLYAVLFEIIIRRCFAPLAVADATRSGPHGPGMHFFKGYLAIYVKMAMFYVIAYINLLILAMLLNNIGDGSIIWGCFGIITLNLTTYKMYGSAGKFAHMLVEGR